MKFFFETVTRSLQRNLWDDHAYLIVLKGLGVTLFISAAGLCGGTICGAILCSLRMSKVKSLQKISGLIIAVLRGSPAPLLLMMLYYVVFAASRVDPVIIAVIGFALNSGAHIAEVMRSALEAVDRRQVEAARMLGFSKAKAFLAIAFPQAAKVAKPVYQNSVINLIQWTSVVGYITITDLTRTVNNIGNRTGDPFFALFFGILIYLGLSYLVYALFALGKRK